MCQPPFSSQPEAHLADFVLVTQPENEVGQALQQREAIHPHPQPLGHLLRLGRDADLLLDSPLRRLDEVDAEHVLQGPARLEGVGEFGHRAVQPLPHDAHLVPDDADETVSLLGLHVRIIQQVLHRGADVRKGSSAALGERLQHLVALALHFEVTRDVVEDEHVAAEEGLAFRLSAYPLPAQHRCHLHANELIGRG